MTGALTAGMCSVCRQLCSEQLPHRLCCIQCGRLQSTEAGCTQGQSCVKSPIVSHRLSCERNTLTHISTAYNPQPTP
eukprot:357202-Chlamydomonas_euryale.AAC.17